MADETVTVLHEIASSLRRRVEQHDEMAKRSEERMSKMEFRTPVMPDISEIREENHKRMESLLEESKLDKQLAKQEKARLESEDRQFKHSLLAEFQRHNNLLEAILTKLAT